MPPPPFSQACRTSSRPQRTTASLCRARLKWTPWRDTRSFRRRIPAPWAVWLCSALPLALLATAPACKRSRFTGARVPTMAIAYDTTPIDAQRLEEDTHAAQHVAGMPAGEVAARLQSFSATAETLLTLSQEGNALLEDKTLAQLSVDKDGGMRALNRGSRHSFEVVAVGEKAYVRLDRGHMRYKGRRDVEVAEMVEVAYSGLRQALQQFGTLRLSDAQAEQQAGREVIRYTVGRNDEETLVADAGHRGPGALFPPGALPTVQPGVWRSQAQKVSLRGTISVDVATGVILQAKIQGQLSCDGPDERPMQLALQVRHSITDIGTLAPIQEPTGAVSEFRRPIRPREPLTFFRDQLAK